MDAQQALALLQQNIKQDGQHTDYQRTVALAEDYRMYVTNEGLENKLRQYKVRETDEAFAQRKRITRPIMKSVLSSLRKPFYKVSRNDKVTRKVTIKDEVKKDAVSKMQDNFYTKSGKAGGLDSFLRTRGVELAFIDPNAWIVVEWGAFAADALPAPYPKEVKAEYARNFNLENGTDHWLYVVEPYTYKTKANTPQELKSNTKNGLRHFLYADNDTVVMADCDPDYLNENPTEVPEGAVVVEFEKKFYLLQSYNHKAGMLCAVRVGYQRDDTTDGRTFVAPYDAATPYFEKLITTISELDISIAGHVFPRFYSYVARCIGPSKEQLCHGGKLANGDGCPTCKGTGFNFHASGQDSIILPLPSGTDVTNNDIIDLSKLSHYAATPIETVQFQRDTADWLEVKSHRAVFNSDVFVQATNATRSTATEKEMDMDSVYDTLAPYADQYSALWVFITTVMVRLAGLKTEEVEIAHAFPGDFKLRTMSQLLTQLERLNKSQAPPFVKDAVNRDLAEVMSGGDKMEMMEYDVKTRFFPFSGKTMDEIMLLMASPYVTEFNKVLYANFDQIFVEIKKDVPNFFLKKFNAQWVIVGEKVNTIMAEIKKGMADLFNAGQLKTPGQTTTTGQEGNDPTGEGNAQ